MDAPYLSDMQKNSCGRPSVDSPPHLKVCHEIDILGLPQKIRVIFYISTSWHTLKWVCESNKGHVHDFFFFSDGYIYIIGLAADDTRVLLSNILTFVTHIDIWVTNYDMEFHIWVRRLLAVDDTDSALSLCVTNYRSIWVTIYVMKHTHFLAPFDTNRSSQ